MWPQSPGSCHVHGHHLAFTSAKQLGLWNKYYQHYPIWSPSFQPWLFDPCPKSQDTLRLLFELMKKEKGPRTLWDHKLPVPKSPPRQSNPRRRDKSINENK